MRLLRVKMQRAFHRASGILVCAVLALLECNSSVTRFLADSAVVSPTVLSMTASPASGTTLETLTQIDITFSAAATGADTLANYTLTGAGAAGLTLGSVTPLSGFTYRLALTGAVQNGQILLTLGNITDSAGTALAGNTITYTGAIVNPTMTPNPAQNSAVGTVFTTVDVTYSETVNAAAAVAANYTASGTGKGTWSTNPATVTQNGGGCGANCYRLVFTGSPTDGSLVIIIANVQDTAGNNLSGTTISYVGGWTKRRRLTIDNSAQAQNLANFPLMVRVDASRIDYANTQNAGQDIRFYDADGTTLLPHEIEKWDEAGSSYVWVKVPQIDASSATDYIWMYYGNPTVADGQNATNVWDANFKGVWHMTSSANDATANANNGTNAGAVTTVAGKTGDARSLNGTNQYINLSGTSIAGNVGAITLSAWVNRSGSPGGAGIACFSIHNGGAATGTSRFAFEVTGTTNFNGIGRTNDSNPGSLATATGPFAATNTWYLVTLVINYSANTIAFYSDGALLTSGSGPTSAPLWSATTDNDSSPSAAIGAFDDGTSPFMGIMDEVRFSNTARSAAWLAADYKSMNDTFITFGPEL